MTDSFKRRSPAADTAPGLAVFFSDMHVSGDLDHIQAAVALLPTDILFITVVLTTSIMLLLLMVISLCVSAFASV